ncbi:DUF1127 domain-containing protein [Ruegeria marina]|uniref:YjiS-like domain-containing protein n=1 Tax=Ruegeria marina TaxID=639004 RepID=A0A1G6KSE8_9RHOB|nr:DUF1127 domain-containing protein [Ruegeria marina]SDC34000.1 protein of unknown function [Ruegeria marina]
MAMASEHGAVKVEQGFGISAMIEAAMARFARYRVYRETVNELSSLSGRELADLGLHRSMIKRIALQAAQEHQAR